LVCPEGVSGANFLSKTSSKEIYWWYFVTYDVYQCFLDKMHSRSIFHGGFADESILDAVSA
jgi:hypothetical protein